MKLVPAPHLFLAGCDLPMAWASQPAWRILDTGFHDGSCFLTAWAAWLADSMRPALLHYVAISRVAPGAEQRQTTATAPLVQTMSALSGLLADRCVGLLPGFHRLEFEQGRMLLTLCIGDLKTMLRQQDFCADSVFLAGLDSPPAVFVKSTRDSAPDATPDPIPDLSGWDAWTVKALARCCRRGTRAASGRLTPALQQALSQSGFEMQQAAPDGGQSKAIFTGIYNPRWEPKNSRRKTAFPAPLPGNCVVVGAGLAGASVAQALARRGWQVLVLDAADAPAAGASGLPVGLMVPHVSADDSPRSRLSRAGIRLMLNQARALLVQGQDWDATGVLERRISRGTGLPPTWPASGMAWSRSGNELLTDTAWGAGLPHPTPALWHACAAWIKPARLVQAWMAQPGVQFQGGARVARICQEGDAWVLLDAANKVLASATTVVLAAAGGCTSLAPTGSHLPPLLAVSGQISWAVQRTADTLALPPYPINGLGSLVAHVPWDAAMADDLPVEDPTENAAGGAPARMAWFTGATYETTTAACPPSVAAQHSANHARLKALVPACARALAYLFSDGSVHAWRGTRYAPADHMPVVGPVVGPNVGSPMAAGSPTLWISTGLGSRGLSLSVLCAELLAARLGAEPLPIEASLAQGLNSQRKTPIAIVPVI